MKLAIEIKQVYGIETIYPACEISRKFCLLLGQKTLTRMNLSTIKELGYTVEIVMPQYKGV